MIKQFFKKVLISYLIIICCIFTPTYRAYAVSAGGWAFSSYNVATSVVTAMKNGASASAAIARSPIVAKIAKGVAGGVIAGAALPLALKQITGLTLTAADWVLDPANNAVKYKDPKVSGYYKSRDYPSVTGNKSSFCRNLESYLESTSTRKYVLDTTATSLDTSGGFCQFYLEGGDRSNYWRFVADFVADPNYYQSIPIPTLADKIYDNAKTDSASASIVNDAVREYVNEGSADTALDAAKADADATHNCGAGTHWSGSACVADTPTNPETPTNPDTPFDPSSIIDAINSVFNAISNLFDAVMSIPDVINAAIDKVLDAIASITDVINLAIDKVINAISDIIKPFFDLLASFINWFKDKFTALYDAITQFFEWVKTTYDDFVKPADDEPTELDIPNNVPTPTDTNIRFGGMCPPNAEINVRIPFATINATLFDWSKWCYNLDTFVKPVIILLAAYFSVLIFRGKNESS